jgi:hypothetical protein
MKRDFFRRGTRMTHKFGEIEGRADPLYGNEAVWQPPAPPFPGTLHTPPYEGQQHGEDRAFARPNSAVCKPTGALASIAGPQEDYADTLARPMPVGTSKRLDHKAKDKG